MNVIIFIILQNTFLVNGYVNFLFDMCVDIYWFVRKIYNANIIDLLRNMSYFYSMTKMCDIFSSCINDSFWSTTDPNTTLFNIIIIQ